MSIFRYIFAGLLWALSLFFSFSTQAGFFDTDTTGVHYCQWWECSFERWVNLLKTGINDIETGRKFSVYIQDVVIYLLTFVTIVWVIYIIYAGFQLMTWGGNEEKLKKTKNIIIYVIIGIILMWLAYPIMKWIIRLLNLA